MRPNAPRLLLLALAGWVLLVAPAGAQVASPPCRFVLGFQTLRDLDPGDVGDCVDNETYASNGDAQQYTTNGMLVWRKADNVTAFTDGFHSLVSGPNGLQERLNSRRFPWEANPDGLPIAVAVAAWTLTFDRVERADSLARTDGNIGQPLTPTGRFLVLYFELRNNGDQPAYRTGNDFSMSDAQGRGYRSSFELRSVQPDGSSAELDGVTIPAQETVSASLTFDVSLNADGLVLHLAGAADMPVTLPA